MLLTALHARDETTPVAAPPIRAMPFLHTHTAAHSASRNVIQLLWRKRSINQPSTTSPRSRSPARAQALLADSYALRSVQLRWNRAIFHSPSSRRRTIV